MMKKIIIVLITLIAAPLFAQKHTAIEDVDLINAHKSALIKEYPHLIDKIKIERVDQINEHHSKIVYYDDGVYHEAIVNSDRKDLLLIATFREIQKSTLPKIVFDAWKQSEFGDWKTEKMYKVTTPYDGWFYSIDVVKDNKTKRLFYSDLGRYKETLY